MATEEKKFLDREGLEYYTGKIKAPATADSLGMVKIGDGLDVGENGVVSTEMQAGDYYTNDETDSLLAKRVKYYSITPSSTTEEIDAAFSDTSVSIINFANGTYNFTKVYEINSNTTILLNNAELHANSGSRLFHIFDSLGVDVTGYSGVHNVKIIGGKVDSCISMIHCMNIVIKGVYFYHGIVDHSMEISACKDVVVDNCKFEGIVAQGSSRQYVEHIQIENATYLNFPWLPSDSDAFDNTGCDCIEVKNCEFVQPSAITHRLYTAIGNHNYIEGYPHSNISIHDNSIINSISNPIRISNTVNLEIKNNIIKETGVSNPNGDDALGIQLFETTTNCYIHNNIIDGFIEQVFISDGSSNVKISENIFKNLPKTTAESEWSNAIKCGRVKCLIIDSNRFVDEEGCIMYSRIRSAEDTQPSDVTFSNNVIDTSSELTDLTSARTRFYACDKLVFKDNVFNENPASGYAIRLYTGNFEIFISGNRFSKIPSGIIDLNGYTGSFANVYGIILKGWTGNTSNLTDQTLDLNYKDFNKALLVYGDGNQTNVIQIKNFGPAYKIDERSCVFATCKQSDSTMAVGKITFSADNKVTTTGANVNIRGVWLVNE